ncbi:MAG: glutamine amidotransferase [Actinobacteria bacterium]|nr:glutamine amidotransferase [Actinomycetota bacterium]
MGGPDLIIAHLYPDLLRTYGDRGNLITLVRRAEWRGFSVRVVGVTRDERIPARANLVLIGGGSDRLQAIVGPDLVARRPELEELTAHDAVIFGICGGYQLLGDFYVAADGRSMPGLGMLDITTGPGKGRIIGRVRAQATLYGDTFECVGFENHGGRTLLRTSSATPLASVPHGQGNNGADGTEGAVQGNVVGTYLHGPVLPATPAFADALLRRALAPRTKGAPLEPLNDRLEEEAHALARTLRR